VGAFFSLFPFRTLFLSISLNFKFRSFSRPTTDSNFESSYLSNKNSKIPSELKDVSASKVYNACCFVPSSTGGAASIRYVIFQTKYC
jgi:hypothetical protein